MARVPVRFLRLAFVGFVLFLVGQAVSQTPPDKRPVRHSDYDTWRSIQGPQISPDGRFVAYSIQAPKGGDLIVYNVENGQEWRHPRGGQAAADPEAKEPPPGGKGKGAGPKGGAGKGAGGKAVFTPDSRFLVFQATPPKSKIPEAPKDKQGGKAGIGILDLSNNNVSYISGVRTFQIAEEGPTFLVYHRAPPPGAAAPDKDKDGKKDGTADEEDLQKGGKGGKGGKGAKGGEQQPPAKKQPQVGSDLVIHSFDGGPERVFKDVLDFQLTKDGRTIVYTVGGPDAAAKGLYTVETAKNSEPRCLQNSSARYSRFTWDEKQQRLAFFVETPEEGKTAKVHVCVWERDVRGNKGGALRSAVTLASMPSLPARMAFWAHHGDEDFQEPPFRAVISSTAGLKEGMKLSNTGAVSFSRDGSKLFFSVAPEAKPAPPQEKAVVELWHWKDDFIPPMQKAKYNQEKNRSYRGVVHLDTGKVLQISDATMSDLSPAPVGPWALGDDDRPYRTLVGFDANYSDYYVVDLRDGTRKPFLQKHTGAVSWSTGGKHALYFADKQWNCVAIPDGKPVNLSANAKTSFVVEDFDSPSSPPSYGVAGWSADDRYVFLHDRFDIWQVAVDGSEAKNITDGYGRKNNLQLRIIRTDPDERTIDPAKPMLLRAEDLRTRDTGFFRLHVGAAPEKLVMGPKRYNAPTKAKEADVYLLTVSTFNEFPDLHVAKNDFRDIKKISNANPQQANFLWGTSEMVHFNSSDGTPLHGVLIKPENFDPKKKYPMIAYIYEKLSQNLHNYVAPKAGTSINHTFYVSNGYLVFLPDIVYKIGYPGQSALKCVLPGIQAVVDRGFVDENAIGIQGHSWGGYQISYMVTQTNRFRAAAAGAPVSNMISAYGGIRWGTGLPRQFQYERTQSRIGGTLWTFPMRFVENSPVFMADRVSTPLLMLHNDNDDAVPWQQGIEYFLALRRLGKEVYMFNYPGEPHGLKKKANQLDYTVRMQEFFDHHLKGAAKPLWMEKGIPYRPRGPEKKGAPGDGR